MHILWTSWSTRAPLRGARAYQLGSLRSQPNGRYAPYIIKIDPAIAANFPLPLQASCYHWKSRSLSLLNYYRNLQGATNNTVVATSVKICLEMSVQVACSMLWAFDHLDMAQVRAQKGRRNKLYQYEM